MALHLPVPPGMAAEMLADNQHNAVVRMQQFDAMPPVMREVTSAVGDPKIAKIMTERFGIRKYQEASDLLARLAEARRAAN